MVIEKTHRDVKSSLVGFLDILGFSYKFQENKDNERYKLISLLRKFERKYNGKFYHKKSPEKIVIRPEVICVSDCIILSMPLDCEKQDQYTRVGTFFNALVEIIFDCMKKGYLIRGGISHGDLYHKKTVIAGVSYIEAVKNEKLAKYPRVIFTEKALDFLSSFHNFGFNRARTFSYYCIIKNKKDKFYWFDEVDFYWSHLGKLPYDNSLINTLTRFIRTLNLQKRNECNNITISKDRKTKIEAQRNFIKIHKKIIYYEQHLAAIKNTKKEDDALRDSSKVRIPEHSISDYGFIRSPVTATFDHISKLT